MDKDGRVLPPGEIKTPGKSGMRNGLLALSAPDGGTLVAWKSLDVWAGKFMTRKASRWARQVR